MRNLFYFYNINIIGGIEQFFAYLTEKYYDYDITIVYRIADPLQLRRLRKYVRCVKFDGQDFECDKAFFCFNIDIRSHVKANEYCLILHGDYKTMVEQNLINLDSYIFEAQFDKYYGVSQVVCDSWKELTGKDCELVYNPFTQYPTKRILKLVYCGRLTSEKGGDLCEKLIKRLHERRIDFLLYVYSNKQVFGDDDIIYLGTRLDASQFLNQDNYDYILIPSKNEGYCYSLVQALANGLPAVVTPCPVFKELGVDSSNSISIDFDGENIDEVIDDMLSRKFDFTYTPKKDIWNKLLAKGKSTYTCKDVAVRVIQPYFDLEMKTSMLVNTEFDADIERAKLLVDKGFAEYVR